MIARELLDHLRRLIERAGDAAALGIDNQGETVVAWDGESGEPAGNAIVWQDARTLPLTEKLKAEGAEKLTHRARRACRSTPISPPASCAGSSTSCPRPSGCWQRGRLRLGTSDSFFLDRLAGSLRHRRHHGLAHQPDESRAPASGTPSSAVSSACPSRSCRRSAPPPAISAAFGKPAARRQPRRPAGRPLRPWLPPAGPGEDHLRHRRLRARRGGPRRGRRRRPPA